MKAARCGAEPAGRARRVSAGLAVAAFVLATASTATAKEPAPAGASAQDASPQGEAPQAEATQQSPANEGPSAAASEESLEAEQEETGSTQDFRDAASPEQKKVARKHFREGNRRVKESLFVQAVDEYELALQQWDHPGIHYNLALALLNLDQPLRLRHHLTESVKFGPDAVGRDKARRAEQYLKLVERQLTELSLVTTQDALVELDGEAVLEGAGSYTAFVRPGQHTLRASGEGFETSSKVLSLVPGESPTVQVKLYTPEEWLVYERRWKPALPIAVTVTGAGLLAAGGALLGVGIAESNRYNDQVRQCPTEGCLLEDVDGSETTGEALQTAGIVTMGVGGATLVVGGVLLYMNRAIGRRVDPESRGEDDSSPALAWLPALAPGYAGLNLGGRF